MSEEKKNRQLSPAARHRERVLAAKNSQSAGEDTQAASQYELKLMDLAQDQRDLKNIKGLDLKAAKKLELLPKYLPWVEGVIASDAGTQDDVLVTMLVWAIDVSQFDLALIIAEYCIKHKLSMTDNYQRDLPNIVAEDIAEAQIKLFTAGQEMSSSIINRAIEITKDCDLFDPVRAKLHKALGYALRTSENILIKKLALDNLKRALELFDKSGVKKDIENLEREIKNSSSA
ncbi:phage terminase small subunit [Methylophilus sp. 3sh_L]|uniref:phage terminase small subunit n=1 Tax=Methylophilus sp. 3sh_L TaxID=3377114 RepID=UPI00398F0E80